MGSVVAGIEAATTSLQNPRLRPSGQEVAQLHELAGRIAQQEQFLREKLTNCAAGWVPEIYQKSDEHMSRAQSAIRTAAQGKIRWSILRRNLVAIYQGHPASTIDSPSLKARKARKAQKGWALRSLNTSAILAWAVSLPPSSWEEMDQLVFNDVVKQMTQTAEGDKHMAEIASHARNTVRNLGTEEPFCNITSYTNFVDSKPLCRSLWRWIRSLGKV